MGLAPLWATRLQDTTANPPDCFYFRVNGQVGRVGSRVFQGERSWRLEVVPPPSPKAAWPGLGDKGPVPNGAGPKPLSQLLL